MNLAAVRALIVKHEGRRLFPYDDATGKPLKPGDTLKGKLTIGYGYNLSDRGITEQLADELLDDDIAARVNDLLTFPWFATLSDNRQAALIDLHYNVGAQKFREFHHMIAAITLRDFNRAAASIEDSRLAPRRRKELAALMREG